MENPSSMSSSCENSRIQNFIALKELKEADLEYDTICNRIKVMHINEERNLKRISNNKQKINSILEIRNQASEELKQKKEVRKKREKSVLVQKQKNEELKENMRQKIKKNIEQIEIKNQKNHEQLKKISEVNEKKISKEKQEHLKDKQKKRELVALSELKSQENIMSFLKNKQSYLSHEKENDKEMLLKKKARKKKDIEELSKIEMKIMEQHSQSQADYKEMKNKLDSMLGRIRREKRQNKQKIVPSFHETSERTSFYEN